MKNTTLVHIEKDGKYLMLHRIKKENDINKDKWIGVGGKIEENESPYTCAIRETFEETGLKIINPEYRGIVTFVPDCGEGEYMHLFTAKNFKGEIYNDCNEGTLEWVDKKALCNMNIWEGDKIFLELLEKNEPFFDLRLEYKGEELVSADLNGKRIKGKEKIIVSACLTGKPCRYDGKSKENGSVAELIKKYELIPVCPECDGGLLTPREPAEISNGKVYTRLGKDVTEEYMLGAKRATALAVAHGCEFAVLKRNSPSCSNGEIYDGTFSGRLIKGKGITASLMEKAEIKVCCEDELNVRSDEREKKTLAKNTPV